MTIALLILAALVLLAAMVVLSISMNDLEKITRTLGALLIKRYTMKPAEKTENSAGHMAPITKIPRKA